jgi:MFS superfamily sulfate permease-like transporter
VCISIEGHFFHNLVSVMDHLPQASVPTILLALAMLALQVGLQRFLPRVTVAAGITASSLAGLSRMGIELVGQVHGGLPSLALPDTSLFPSLWPAAVGIALMSFVETAAARRNGLICFDLRARSFSRDFGLGGI